MCIFLGQNRQFKNYGFNNSGEWSNQIGWAFRSNTIEATPQEVETALIKEAKKRGFKEGVKIISPSGNDWGYVLKSCEYSYDYTFSCGVFSIMKDGIWATIIKETTTELNGEYTKVQLTDILNNRF